jgi:hypothetical protein
MKKTVSIVLVLFLLAAALPSFAYEPIRDLWQWNTFSIDKKINDRWSASFDEEVRLFHNISQLNLCYTNLGLSYKATKFLKISIVYRSIQKKQADGTFSFRHRLYTDWICKKKADQFIFSYRARFQAQVRDYYSSSDGQEWEKYWRSKFEVRYDGLKKIQPYVAAEFRYQFRNNRLTEANYMFNRGRYAIGFDYGINKKNTIGAYYLLQKEFNINAPEDDSVLGLSYSLSL